MSEDKWLVEKAEVRSPKAEEKRQNLEDRMRKRITELLNNLQSSA
jgi:hypothetical protein